METLVIRNTKLKWAHLGHISNSGEYASGKYEVTITLTPEQAEELRGSINARQKIKVDKDGDQVITIKSTTLPPVKGPNGAMMTPDEADKVGNGTIANVRVTLYQAKGMTFAGLGAVLIKDLKEYTGTGNLSDLEDGETSSEGLGDLEDD